MIMANCFDSVLSEHLCQEAYDEACRLSRGVWSKSVEVDDSSVEYTVLVHMYRRKLSFITQCSE
jgi:hypothetical protein